MENNKGRTIRKVMGGGGDFRATGIFFVIKFLVWIFFRPWYEYFLGLIGVQEFFSFSFPLLEYFFCTSLAPHPSHPHQAYERRTPTEVRPFPWICLDANKFVLLGFFSLITTICPKIFEKRMSLDFLHQKLHVAASTCETHRAQQNCDLTEASVIRWGNQCKPTVK